MNADRRKQIEKAIELMEEAKGILENCKDEEQDYLDNMPESLQMGDKGQKAGEAIENLDGCDNLLDEAIANALNASE